MTHQRTEHISDLSRLLTDCLISACEYWDEASHLQAGDGEAASVVRQSGDGDDERRVWDVLIVELNGHLIVAWREEQQLMTEWDTSMSLNIILSRSGSRVVSQESVLTRFNSHYMLDCNPTCLLV